MLPEPVSPSSPIFSISDGRAVIRLNRPVQHNRIEPSDVKAFREILDQIEKNDAIRVLVLTGTGRSFCAGYDLVSLATVGQKNAGAVHAFERLVDRLEACRVPTICGLNGPAYGGGADLALACDFRVGVSDIRVVIPAGELGVHYYHGGLRRFVTRLGMGAAKRVFLFSQALDSAALLRIGFLDEIVPTAEALQQRIDKLVGAIAAAPVPAAVEGMKQALNRIAAGDMDSGATDAAWEESIRSPAVARAAADRLAARRHVSKKVV